MDERTASFERFLEQLSAGGTADSAEILLRQLDPDSAQLLRLCAIPQQFSVGVMRVMAPGLEEEAAQERFKEFSRLSIMCAGTDLLGNPTLSMHDAARRPLFEKWLRTENAQEFSEVSRRLAELFGSLMPQADGVLLETLGRRRMYHLLGVEQDQGMAEFETLFYEQQSAYRLSGCEALCKLVQEYSSVLTGRNMGRLDYQRGKLAAGLRQWFEAKEFFNRVLNNPEVAADLRIKALNRLGMAFAAEGEPKAAMRRYHEALQVAAAIQDAGDLVIRTYHEMGAVYRDEGEWNHARKYLQMSIGLAEDRGKYVSVAIAYNSMGALERKLGEPSRAIAAYEDSLRYLERAGDKFRTAGVYNQLAMTYVELGNWARSREYLENARNIEHSAGDLHGEAITLNNLVRIYRNIGLMDEAIAAAQQSIPVFVQTRDLLGAAHAQRNLGTLYAHMDRMELARPALEAAREMFQRARAPEEAEQTAKIIHSLDHRDTLPWWGVLSIGLAILIFVALIIFVIAALRS